MADVAQSEELRASFLRLEASWLRLAEAVEKTEEAEEPPPLPGAPDQNRSSQA